MEAVIDSESGSDTEDIFDEAPKSLTGMHF